MMRTWSNRLGEQETLNGTEVVWSCYAEDPELDLFISAHLALDPDEVPDLRCEVVATPEAGGKVRHRVELVHHHVRSNTDEPVFIGELVS